MGNNYKIYALFRNIVSPRRPRDLSFEEIVDNLTKHLDPKLIVIAERFKFHKVEQQAILSLLVKSKSLSRARTGSIMSNE